MAFRFAGLKYMNIYAIEVPDTKMVESVAEVFPENPFRRREIKAHANSLLA